MKSYFAIMGCLLILSGSAVAEGRWGRPAATTVA